ncbi:unnamed protein product [Cuscuta epithymum]|uniref:hAT-like transposase RNase-H fold domain-containing protein n=1 Tax=Cuscuta epithymum TaxID=186058 RepID=A0AAV0CUN8_9ASTE|nr:unnamed protein product [Cuscuta epithymum]
MGVELHLLMSLWLRLLFCITLELGLASLKDREKETSMLLLKDLRNKMEGGRYSVDLGNLQRNRRNEIGRKKSRKGKELAGSSSQSRDDFETGYQRRDGDAMSEEQLQQELARHNNRFLQQQQMPTTIDEEELEDEDAEELEPEMAEEEGAGSHDADAPASSQTATGNKKSKSELMKNNFDKWKDPQTGYWHATCKWCNNNYSLETSGGYGSAARHLKAKHPVEYAKLGGGTGKQTQISRFANSQPFGNFSYNDAQNLTGMANLICEENLPYLFSESLALRDYAQGSLNPQFRNYSRKTVKKEIIRLYNAEKERLQIFFANFDGRVTICSDIWEDDFHHLYYLDLTAHYIDEDWNMHKRVLAFREFNDRHTAEHIYILIERILIEYNLIDKVFAIGFDNATNNTAAIPRLRELCGANSLMGRFFHQRCACHVINLCVQDGLKALGDSMEVIKGGGGGGVRRIWGNGQLRLKWQSYLTERGVRYVVFPKDLSIRWNSTYKLLKVVLRYKEHFPAFLKEHDNYIINAAEIDTCEKICNVLIYFFNATETFSHVYKPTANQFIPQAVNLADAFKEFQNAVFVHYFCDYMKEKFLKYYAHIPHIYGIAFILDPRYRLANLEDCFNFYYLAFFGEFPMYEDNPIDPKTEYNETGGSQKKERSRF